MTASECTREQFRRHFSAV